MNAIEAIDALIERLQERQAIAKKAQGVQSAPGEMWHHEAVGAARALGHAIRDVREIRAILSTGVQP